MDDANPKKHRPLSAQQRLKNLTDTLSEDALNDPTPLTPEEEAEAARVKKELLERVKAETWQETESERKAAPKKNYIN